MIYRTEGRAVITIDATQIVRDADDRQRPFLATHGHELAILLSAQTQ